MLLPAGLDSAIWQALSRLERRQAMPYAISEEPIGSARRREEGGRIARALFGKRLPYGRVLACSRRKSPACG